MSLAKYIQSVRDSRDAEQQKIKNTVMPVLNMRYNILQKEVAEEKALGEATTEWESYWADKYKDKPEELNKLMQIEDVAERNKIARRTWADIPTETIIDQGAGMSTTSKGGIPTHYTKTIPKPEEIDQTELGAQYNIDMFLSNVDKALVPGYNEKITKWSEQGANKTTIYNALVDDYKASHPEDKAMKILAGSQDEYVKLRNDFGYEDNRLKAMMLTDPVATGNLKIMLQLEEEKTALQTIKESMDNDNWYKYEKGKFVETQLKKSAKEGSRILESKLSKINEKLKKYEYLKSPEPITSGEIKELEKERKNFYIKGHSIFGKESRYYYGDKKITKEEYNKRTIEISRQIAAIKAGSSKEPSPEVESFILENIGK